MITSTGSPASLTTIFLSRANVEDHELLKMDSWLRLILLSNLTKRSQFSLQPSLLIPLPFSLSLVCWVGRSRKLTDHCFLVGDSCAEPPFLCFASLSIQSFTGRSRWRSTRNCGSAEATIGAGGSKGDLTFGPASGNWSL